MDFIAAWHSWPWSWHLDSKTNPLHDLVRYLRCDFPIVKKLLFTKISHKHDTKDTSTKKLSLLKVGILFTCFNLGIFISEKESGGTNSGKIFGLSPSRKGNFRTTKNEIGNF